MRSVLASRPVARAKVRTYLGGDDHHRQVSQGQGGHQALFVSGGGLQDDPVAGPLLAELQNALDAFGTVVG